jgi:4-coumarate--CoA ligase
MPKFDLERFCAITETRRISYASVVPPVISALAKSPIVDKYDLSSVRRMMSGAAPLKKDIMELVYKRLKIPLLQGYGLSETSPVTHQQASPLFLHYLLPSTLTRV